MSSLYATVCEFRDDFDGCSDASIDVIKGRALETLGVKGPLQIGFPAEVVIMEGEEKMFDDFARLGVRMLRKDGYDLNLLDDFIAIRVVEKSKEVLVGIDSQNNMAQLTQWNEIKVTNINSDSLLRFVCTLPYLPKYKHIWREELSTTCASKKRARASDDSA